MQDESLFGIADTAGVIEGAVLIDAIEDLLPKGFNF